MPARPRCSPLSPSFFLLITNLSGPLFGDVFGALQALACVVACLALPTLRHAFLAALAKTALQPRVVAALDEPPQAQQASRSPVSLEGLTLGLAGSGGGSGSGTGARLGPRNLACLRELDTAAMFLTGTLGPSWATVLWRSGTRITSLERAVPPCWFSNLESQHWCYSWDAKQAWSTGGVLAKGLAGGGQ